MHRLLALLTTLGIAGCTSQILQGYVGQPVTEVILDRGPPVNVVELEEGRRAYQWAGKSGGFMPVTTPSSTTVFGPGGAVAIVPGTSTSYVPYSTNCVDTLYATRQGSEWIVEGFRQPSLECE